MNPYGSLWYWVLPPVDDCEYCGAALTILGVNSEGWVAECANGHQVVLKDDEL